MISFKGSGRAPLSASGAGPTSAALLQRSQRGVFVLLILLTIGAWGLTIIQTQSMVRMDAVVASAVPGDAPSATGEMDAMSETNAMGEMGAMPEPDGTASTGMADMAGTGWSLGGLAAFVAAWAVMMTAMMLPAVTPLLLLYRSIAAKSMSSETAFASTWILGGGYLLVWTLVGVAVYALVRLGAELASFVGLPARAHWAPIALGAILVVAGLYQFTPLKHACLRQCQSPFGFLMGHWRGGSSGALRLGVIHGAYCLGCCWALFAVLVAAGVMSLAWMLLLTLVVFAEKVLPMGRRTTAGVGAALLVFGILIAGGLVTMPGMV